VRSRPALHLPPPKPGCHHRPAHLDGSRVFIHAVIDNFSRRILAWHAASRLEPGATCSILAVAAKNLPTKTAPAAVITDSGVENVNHQVDALLGTYRPRRVLDQVDIDFSNSMIEAWWRSLKHSWLYPNQLDSLATIRNLVALYVEQHNSVMPHSAFRGQTPDEVYFRTAGALLDDLAEKRRAAREARIAANVAIKCEDCRPPPSHSTAHPSHPISSVVPVVL
jgi:putative transposase